MNEGRQKINLNINEKLAQILEGEAERSGMSRAKVIASALKLYLTLRKASDAGDSVIIRSRERDRILELFDTVAEGELLAKKLGVNLRTENDDKDLR